MKTCITTYSYGGVPAAVMNSYIDLSHYITSSKKETVLHTIREDALICRSRCRSTRRFLNTNCDVWVQMDHDIEFKPEDVFELAKKAIEMNSPVCVPYTVRGYPTRCALRPMKQDQEIVPGSDEIVEIQMCATGFMAVPRTVIEETIKVCSSSDVPEQFRIYNCGDVGLDDVPTFPTLWKPIVIEVKDGEYEYLSEDYSGSARMTIAGFKQYAWTKPKVSHWGEHAYKL